MQHPSSAAQRTLNITLLSLGQWACVQSLGVIESVHKDINLIRKEARVQTVPIPSFIFSFFPNGPKIERPSQSSLIISSLEFHQLLIMKKDLLEIFS